MKNNDPISHLENETIGSKLETPSSNDTENVEIGSKFTTAAGIPAIIQTARFGFSQMGVGRTIDQLLRLNQKKGFDCQSCSWPSPDEHRHVAEFCENGAKAVADEATRKKATREFFAENSVSFMAQQSDYWLNQQGRLVEPMVLRSGATHYEPISWENACSLIANELNSLKSPNEASFYTSGRTGNEAAFVYQLFARQFGTNNLPDCSNMCHESSGYALKESLGMGKTTITLEGLENADAIFIIGQNPGTNHPRMLTSLQKAKKRGCKIISINPLPETGNLNFKNPQDFMNPLKAPMTLLGKGTSISDLWVQIRPSGDMAFFKGLGKEFLAAEIRHPGNVLAHDFIRDHTIGFEAYRDNLNGTTWEDILAATGITRDEIRAAAEIAMGAKNVVACWAMGLTQQIEATRCLQELLNFLLMLGQMGRPEAGPCCVRGHSNVQGDRTMGVWEKMDEKFLKKLDEAFNFKSPRAEGLDSVKTIKAMHDGKVKVFFSMGGNFHSATPDTAFTAAALRRCMLTVQVSTKLNQSHLVTGEQALILPTLGRTDRDVQASGEQMITTEDTMNVINPSRGTLTPPSPDLLSEVAIVCRMARAVLGQKTTVDWQELEGNYVRIRDHIEKVVPGFTDFDRRIKQGPFYLPNAVRDENRYETRSGRAVFSSHPLTNNDLPAGQFALMTIRSHDQFNTTIYGLDDRYRGVFNGRRVVFLHEQDIRELKLMQGQMVDLTSHYDGKTRVAEHFSVVPYSIPRRCAATYFPEANVLVSVDSVTRNSNTPVYKHVPITIKPAARPEVAYEQIRAQAFGAAQVSME